VTWYNPATWTAEGTRNNLFGSSGKTVGDYQQPTQFQDRNQIQGIISQGLAGVNGRTAPQANQQSAYAPMQMQQAHQLMGIASGQQKGAGELAAQRQVQTALAGQQAQARMARGGNAALAYRDAARNGAGIGLAGAGMAQQAALQDQTNAQGLLTNALGQARGQDQQMQLANLDAQLKARGMDDQQRVALLSQLTGMNAAQLQAQIGAYSAAAQDKGLAGSMLAATGQVIGAAAMASDERLKRNISDGDNAVDEMLENLKPYRYSYIDERFGKGPRLGIMAQDMERSAAGRDVVTETTDGKMLDVNKALSATLAAASRLHQRLRKVESTR
jgi:hypothetical protein